MLGVGNIQSYLKWLHICTAEVSFLSAWEAMQVCTAAVLHRGA